MRLKIPFGSELCAALTLRSRVLKFLFL